MGEVAEVLQSIEAVISALAALAGAVGVRFWVVRRRARREAEKVSEKEKGT